MTTAGGILTAATLALMLGGAVAAQERPVALDYFKLVPGFIAEKKNDYGFGIGYSQANPWGEYNAYLMMTNARGQRTWRLEQYQEMAATGLWQGSTMYLLEGSNRALLIDTAQPSRNSTGVNDLRTLVRYLLGHESDGSVRTCPLDFVVANTHSHPDHIGENAAMSDRTVYYMDGDWPQDAPANYVPIREAGGATANGKGQAVGEIDLGDRMLVAIAIPPHTPGSTGYLDIENQLFMTGDAVGSAWPWLHGAVIAEYAAAMDHVAAVTRNVRGLAVLPAHFYQIDAYQRREGPLDYRYILDQRASAHGIVNGIIEGEPAYVAGPTAYWGGVGSAKLTYSLGGVDTPGRTPRVNYRAVRIPGSAWKREWVRDPAHARLFDIKSEMHLIRGSQGEVLYLVKGSRAGLLFGTSTGGPGLSGLLKSLGGKMPIEVAALGNERLLGLDGIQVRQLEAGTLIELGTDGAGQPLKLQVHALRAGTFSLLSGADRVLFVGDTQSIKSAPAGWHQATDGRYDLVYSTTSDRWFTPAFEFGVAAGSAPSK